jgi:hypothetical protein
MNCQEWAEDVRKRCEKKCKDQEGQQPAVPGPSQQK